MDRGRIIAIVALIGFVIASFVCANVSAVEGNEFIKPVRVDKDLVENKIIVSYFLNNENEKVTVNDLEKGFDGLKKVNGEEVKDKTAIVGTGTTFVANDIEYTVVVYGDIDGNGIVDQNDAIETLNLTSNQEPEE